MNIMMPPKHKDHSKRYSAETKHVAFDQKSTRISEETFYTQNSGIGARLLYRLLSVLG